MSNLALMGGGVETDIATGLPRVINRTPDERAADAQAKMAEAIHAAITLQQELATSPVLGILLAQFNERLTELANNDPICQTILNTLIKMRHTIEVVPTHAQRRFREVLGPGITVPPFTIPNAAPSGIPAEE
jgi:hypothetical protein